MPILDKGLYLDPKYDYFNKYVNVAYKGFWTPAKYEQDIEEIDVPHFNNLLSETSKETIRRCILAVSMVEDKVKTYWPTISFDIPHTIISDAGGLMGQMEVTHRRSYHALAKGLKVDMEDTKKHSVLQGRIKYLTKYLEKDPKVIGKKRVLKRLVLFTSLVEKCSLFTQFYILMSFAKRKQSLKAISDLQRSTAIEENVHYSFGLDIINIIKDEYPQLWSNYLVEAVEKNIEAAYRSERNLIDWFFEKGVPSHLSKDEVKNFLKYNFYTVNKDLELGLNFNYDETMLKEKSLWFVEATKAPVNPDFFDGNVGGYSSEKKETNINTFKF